MAEVHRHEFRYDAINAILSSLAAVPDTGRYNRVKTHLENVRIGCESARFQLERHERTHLIRSAP